MDQSNRYARLDLREEDLIAGGAACVGRLYHEAEARL
jgi:hypothetical protein